MSLSSVEPAATLAAEALATARSSDVGASNRIDKAPPATVTGRPREALQIVDDSPPVGVTAEDESSYPTGTKLLSALFAAYISMILIGLDMSILATAIPSITDDFRTVGDIGWYSAGFRLTLCSFQFMFGKVYRVWSVKLVFLTCIAGFEFGSLLCGLAPRSSVLIFGRAVQGIGAAGMLQGCYVTLLQSVPLRKRPLYAGSAALVEEMAGVTAPLIGGVLTSRLSWRWCFFIQLPLGGVALLVIGLFSKDFRPSPLQHLPLSDKIQMLDLVGTAIFVPGIVSLLLALQFGGSVFGWDDPRIIVLILLSAALAGAFAWWQIRGQEKATLPPRIISQRSILAGMWFAGLNNGALSVVQIYMSIYFQSVKNVSAQASGVLGLPLIIGFMVAIFLGGGLTTAIGYYTPVMFATSILTPIAAGLLSSLPVSATLFQIIFYQAMLGFGAGIGFQGPQMAVQSILSSADVSIGIAAVSFAQSFGPAIFVPVAQTLFTDGLAKDLAIAAPGVNSTNLGQVGLSDLNAQVAPAQLAGVLTGFDKALSQTLYLPVAMACATVIGTLGMDWRSVKHKRS